WSAVQEDDRLARRVTAHLVVQLVPVADPQVPGLVRLDLRVEGAQVRAVTASGVHGSNLPRDARCSGAGLRATLGSMYTPAEDRYETMPMRYCGRSGLQLPLVSLGLWQNFGDTTALETQREIVYHAFDRGITQIDLANNYGPPPGAAEENF